MCNPTREIFIFQHVQSNMCKKFSIANMCNPTCVSFKFFGKICLAKADVFTKPFCQVVQNLLAYRLILPFKGLFIRWIDYYEVEISKMHILHTICQHIVICVLM